MVNLQPITAFYGLTQRWYRPSRKEKADCIVEKDTRRSIVSAWEPNAKAERKKDLTKNLVRDVGWRADQCRCIIPHNSSGTLRFLLVSPKIVYKDITSFRFQVFAFISNVNLWSILCSSRFVHLNGQVDLASFQCPPPQSICRTHSHDVMRRGAS